jgi:hypothetical protein
MAAREITDSVKCECCDCGTDYQSKYEVHDRSECPNACAGEGDPCFTYFNKCPPSCSGATVTFDIESKEFSRNCINGSSPKAHVICSFDDYGNVTGDGEPLECDETKACNSCTVDGVITPKIINVDNGKIKLSVTVNGFNAYWGGPYGATASVEFYFE